MVEVENFYLEYSKENLPEFQVDDRLVAGMEFFESFAPDIAPAAGLGVSERGGRYSSFADGDLMAGVGRLGNLDENFNINNPDGLAALEPLAFSPARTQEEGEAHSRTLPPVVTPPPATPPPVEPPPPPRPSANAYDVRAVLHSLNAEEGEHVAIGRVGQGGNAITPIGWAAFGTENMEDYLEAEVNGNGELVFTLTLQGVLACLSSPLEGYYRVMGNDGQEHTVQVYVPQNSNDFNSHTFQSQHGDDAWYLANAIQGETHDGKSLSGGEGYNITSGGKDDKIHLTGHSASGGATIINTGDGHDEINIEGFVGVGANGDVAINAGKGDDKINIEGAVAVGVGANGDVAINGGDGDDTIHIGGDVQADGGDIRISGGAGDDTILIGGDVQADGGDIRISGGAGDDEINIGRVSSYGGFVAIDGGDGDDKIHIAGYIGVGPDSPVTISGGDGDDEIHIQGIDSGVAGGASSSIVIDGGAGDDKIHIGTIDSWGRLGSLSSISINAGDGDDEINITGSIESHSSLSDGSSSSVAIDGGAGHDKINISSVSASGYPSSVAIDGGAGHDEINIGRVTSYGGFVAIDGGDGDDKIHIGNVTVAAYASNSLITIDGGAGDDEIRIGNVTASSAATLVTIDGGDGNDTIHIGGDVATSSSSLITIDAGDGNDITRVGGSISGNGVTIDGGAGVDALFLDSFGGDFDSLEDLLSAGTVQNMEILVGGGDFSNIGGLADIGININGAGKIDMGGDWRHDGNVGDRAHYTYVGTDPDYGGVIASVEMNALAGA
ncbi:MAG: hypothetical protein LBC94_07755 [Desulfovibrio sp.]|nr:hypothetical protein [Desulfovibrio sp.]